MEARVGEQFTDELMHFVVGRNLSVDLYASSILVWLGIGLVAVYAIARLAGFFGIGRSFDIEEAEIGLGDQKITLRPNDTDRQIAYQIWVELSTRKIGLPIDLDDDVVIEIYDSWYSFFGVTRELLKDVPVAKFRRADTEKIIRLSMEVLNVGIRPHLTKWQARFRRWYEHTMAQEDKLVASPQDVQQEFPQFADLKEEMQEVNHRLMAYRRKMHQIVSGK
jgi:hypothetical protein